MYPPETFGKKRGGGYIFMTPALKEVYVVIDEYWKTYGFGPSIDDIMYSPGARGRGNVARKVKALIELGYCRGKPRRARSVRPSYMRVRDIE